MTVKWMGESFGSNDRNKGNNRLIASYVHTGNIEIQPTSIDWVNALITCSAPHGLSANTEVLLVPNNIDLFALHNNMWTIPEEWTTTNFKPVVSVVDATTLKMTKTDGTTAWTVNTGLPGNALINATQFHLEIAKPWSLTNIPPTKVLKFISTGYYRMRDNYRYMDWKAIKNDGTIVSPPYLNPLGFTGSGWTPAQSYNAIWGVQEWILDLTKPIWTFTQDSTLNSKRATYTGNVTNGVRDQTKLTMTHLGSDVEGLIELKTLGALDQYSYMSNKTLIQLFDLGGR